MPEIWNWLAANPARWVVPAVLLVAVVGLAVMLWRERRLDVEREVQREMERVVRNARRLIRQERRSLRSRH
jgi:hypothetical protein